MNTPNNLDNDVLQALRAGRKIEAIKLVRERQKIGLKEAKELVEDYVDHNPDIYPKHAKVSPGARFMLVTIAILASIAFWIFQSRQV